MLSMEEINTISKRAETTTSGPWTVKDIDGIYCVCSEEFRYGEMFSLVLKNDAEFIAHTREDIPKLLEEIKRMKSMFKHLAEISEELYEIESIKNEWIMRKSLESQDEFIDELFLVLHQEAGL